MISFGSQVRATCLSASLPFRPRTLSLPLKEKAARNTSGSTKGHPYLGGRGHARSVRVGEVEPRQEVSGISETHPVDMIGEPVVAVQLDVLAHHIVNLRRELPADQARQLDWVVKAVAAPERRLLGQLRKGQE